MNRKEYWQRKYEILNLLHIYKTLSAREISVYLQMDIRQVRVYLNRLRHQNLIKRYKLGTLNVYVYMLTEEGEREYRYLSNLVSVKPYKTY